MRFSFIALFAFVTASSAFAMPNVGDTAVFTLTDSQGGQTVNGSFQLTLVSFNSSANTWDEKSTITLNGQTRVQDATVSTSTLMSDATAQQILTQCAQLGGSSQRITVPAGTFNTCMVPTSGNGTTGTIWLSSVVFGIVQSETNVTATGEKSILKLSAMSGN